MDQRVRLIQEHQEGESISALAEIYDVSRRTIYKWLKRHGSAEFRFMKVTAFRNAVRSLRSTGRASGALTRSVDHLADSMCRLTTARSPSTGPR